LPRTVPQWVSPEQALHNTSMKIKINKSVRLKMCTVHCSWLFFIH
jgi:hypothetical protein